LVGGHGAVDVRGTDAGKVELRSGHSREAEVSIVVLIATIDLIAQNRVFCFGESELDPFSINRSRRTCGAFPWLWDCAVRS
jgi:hypothetical protein